jgi:hypothetical protein
MTEYDFSPEAYDRYLRTQQRIAQWVDNTEAHRPQFGKDVHHLVDASHLHPPRPGAGPVQPGHRPTRSMHDVAPPYHRRQSSSSTSSSSADEAPYRSPTHQHAQPYPTVVPGMHPLYQPQPQQPLRPPMRRRSSSTQHYPSHASQHKHHRSHIQTYVLTPPPNTPAPQYAYAYNVGGAGNIVSPGPYGLASGKGSTYVSPYSSAVSHVPLPFAPVTACSANFYLPFRFGRQQHHTHNHHHITIRHNQATPSPTRTLNPHLPHLHSQYTHHPSNNRTAPQPCHTPCHSSARDRPCIRR